MPRALLGVFAIAGLGGLWSELPAAVLLAGLSWLPGRVLLDRRVRGPGAMAVEVVCGLLCLLPAVLPLFLLHRDLGEARYTLAGLYLLIALFPFAKDRDGDRQPLLQDHGHLWLAAAGTALVLLVPALVFGGPTIDDWWDLAFIRSYVDGSLGFGEAMFDGGLVHPRFMWNSWLVLQALVVEFSGYDAALLQTGLLTLAVCLLSVSALCYFAEAVFGLGPAATASVLCLPLWVHGTEALPYFTRLHQDKFTAALVFMPVLLGATLNCLKRGRGWNLAVVAVAAVSLCAVHSLVYCVATLGVALCVVAFTVTGRSGLRAQAPVLLAAAVPAFYPILQAIMMSPLFAAQGISFASPDNPVVRAHLWLGRLLWTDSSFYIVNPGAVFGPLALLALLGAGIAFRQRRDPARAALALLAAVPLVLLFTPGLPALVGKLLMPWMLYRIGWLVPVTLLAGVLAEWAWTATAGWQRRGLVCFLILAFLWLAVPVGADRVRRGMSEHPVEKEYWPRGTTLAAYEFLSSTPRRGPVLAPARFSRLMPALSGRAAVAVSERGTLVFTGHEGRAYQRLRDSAAFFSASLSLSARSRIIRRYGAEHALFRRTLVSAGSDARLLQRHSAEGVVLNLGARRWADDTGALLEALPPGSRVVFENRDFVIVSLPDLGLPVSEAEEPGAWLEVLGPLDGVEGAEPPAGAVVLASLSGYPGSLVSMQPPPFAAGRSPYPVWSGGGALWEDPPYEVEVALTTEVVCRPQMLEVLPLFRRQRREVWDISVAGRSLRLRAEDNRSLFVALDGAATDSVRVGLRPLMGGAFGLRDLRLWGQPGQCSSAWRAPGEPTTAASDMSEQRLLETALTYPGQGRALVALASRLADGGRGRDALALLRKGGDKGPKSSAAWIEAGLIYDAEGRFAEALASYRRSLLVDSNNAWARGCLAWAELRRGRLGRAYYQARRALRLDPRYADALTIIAGVQRRLGLVGRAESSLVSAIALDRQRSWAYLELARLKYDGGDGPAALNVLTDFLTISPNDEDALALLARLSGS